MYPEIMVIPMREELTRAGLKEVRSAAEVDAATGETVRVFSWPLSGAHRGRPAALDILARDDSVLIASPAAGGIVEIDREVADIVAFELVCRLLAEYLIARA